MFALLNVRDAGAGQSKPARDFRLRKITLFAFDSEASPNQGILGLNSWHNPFTHNTLFIVNDPYRN